MGDEPTDLQVTLAVRYRDMPAAAAARRAKVPEPVVRRARSVLGRCPENGAKLARKRDAADDDGFEGLARMMRANRGGGM